MTVRHVLDAAETGGGDDWGPAVAVAVADAPGSTADREADGEGPATSPEPAGPALVDDAADDPTGVDAGPPDTGACVGAGVVPPQAVASSTNVAKMPANFVPAKETTVRRDRIEGL